MTDALTIRNLTLHELVDYVCAQILSVVPIGKESQDRHLVATYIDVTLERLAVCGCDIVHWTPDEFDPLQSSQHATFLYLLANTIWRETAEESTPTKLFLLNKAHHGIELFFKVTMPPVFMLGHTVGIVLGDVAYGNYFSVFQNTTVGRFDQDRPSIGAGVVLFPNTSVIGRCRIGDRTVVSPGTNLVNQDAPAMSPCFDRPDATSCSRRGRRASLNAISVTCVCRRCAIYIVVFGAPFIVDRANVPRRFGHRGIQVSLLRIQRRGLIAGGHAVAGLLQGECQNSEGNDRRMQLKRAKA